MGLLSFLGFGPKQPQPQQPPSGGLLSAPSGVNQKAYNDYVIDMQSNGKAPLSMKDWAAQQAKAAPSK